MDRVPDNPLFTIGAGLLDDFDFQQQLAHTTPITQGRTITETQEDISENSDNDDSDDASDLFSTSLEKGATSSQSELGRKRASTTADLDQDWAAAANMLDKERKVSSTPVSKLGSPKALLERGNSTPLSHQAKQLQDEFLSLKKPTLKAPPVLGGLSAAEVRVAAIKDRLRKDLAVTEREGTVRTTRSTSQVTAFKPPWKKGVVPTGQPKLKGTFGRKKSDSQKPKDKMKEEGTSPRIRSEGQSKITSKIGTGINPPLPPEGEGDVEEVILSLGESMTKLKEACIREGLITKKPWEIKVSREYHIRHGLTERDIDMMVMGMTMYRDNSSMSEMVTLVDSLKEEMDATRTMNRELNGVVTTLKKVIVDIPAKVTAGIKSYDISLPSGSRQAYSAVKGYKSSPPQSSSMSTTTMRGSPPEKSTSTSKYANSEDEADDVTSLRDHQKGYSFESLGQLFLETMGVHPEDAQDFRALTTLRELIEIDTLIEFAEGGLTEDQSAGILDSFLQAMQAYEEEEQLEDEYEALRSEEKQLVRAERRGASKYQSDSEDEGI
ncbi:TPA_asm: P [Kobresia betacytorhabdovirus 1]|nr:TPA_asm: P [Kobresia betacytorhabdovirus 1]